ncbi:MAG: hypothetical protein KAJ96_04880, partial [Candidatus Thorarchaeota archaeon]|nr:hypothetical protein [Candidatus Thorarchaeota archaeon]
EIATFSEQMMSDDFEIAYLRERYRSAEGEAQEQMREALEDSTAKHQRNLGDVWMAKVMAWLHQAGAASGPFVEQESEDKGKEASRYLAAVYTMLEKPFSAIPSKVDGTQKLRRVALGHKAYSLVQEAGDAGEKELAELRGKNKAAEAEFYDEFLNDLIGQESTFRQAFNPFDELIWRDILSSFIFEQATDLYNEAIPHFKESKAVSKQKLSSLDDWKANTAGLSEVYLGMTYNDIADAQMRSGNLEDAAKLYTSASDAFGRAEKSFGRAVSLQPNAKQSRNDKEHKKAQAHFCNAETSSMDLSQLLVVNNKKEAIAVLKDILKDLKKAEKLSKTRELTGAISENLKTFLFVKDLLKQSDNIQSITSQIDFAKDLRKTGLIKDVNKALDEAQKHMGTDPAESLEAIREGLDSLGILLSVELEDEEVGNLRNKTLAILNNVKYVIQFQLSSQLQQGVKFIMSRILENLHAAEAASYYKVIGEMDTAKELMDLGRLALATAFASEAQVFAKKSEQGAFRAQIERNNALAKLADELAEFEDEDSLDEVIKAHDNTLLKIKQAVVSFESAANELASVKIESIRQKNNVDGQVKQLQGVVMKFRGDLLRMEGAKSDFLAEYMYRKGEKNKARKYYSKASDQLREAVGNYNYAAQVFQQIGDTQAAQNVETKAKTADLLARGVWDNKQRLGRDQDPMFKQDAELAILYLGGAGQ